MKKVALITGITGQDGSYLAELLLEKNYEVHGIIRRSSSFNSKRIDHIFDRLYLHYGDMTDSISLSSIISVIKPDELYNLAAQSHVKLSFEQPYYTGQVDAMGTLALLEAVRIHSPNTRVYQASTSELYGGMGYNMPKNGYNEDSIMHPRSPYGVSKLYAYWISKNYREAYNLYISNGILFNHESERRGETFVTRKITKGLCDIKKKIDLKQKYNTLKLGNIYTKRDWGYAKDFVKGMWLMLQSNIPDDYVLATNNAYSIKDFIELSFSEIGWECFWDGEEKEEKCYNQFGDLIIEIDEKYYRPSEVNHLKGDYSKAKKELGWIPETSFKDLVKLMIKNDIK
jgi:GDPmannose 4,6-dehydratase